jgi:hypothetical protein
MGWLVIFIWQAWYNLNHIEIYGSCKRTQSNELCGMLCINCRLWNYAGSNKQSSTRIKNHKTCGLKWWHFKKTHLNTETHNWQPCAKFSIEIKAKRLSKVYFKRKTWKSKWVEYIQVNGNGGSLLFGNRIKDCDIVSTYIVIYSR